MSILPVLRDHGQDGHATSCNSPQENLVTPRENGLAVALVIVAVSRQDDGKFRIVVIWVSYAVASLFNAESEERTLPQEAWSIGQHVCLRADGLQALAHRPHGRARDLRHD